METRVSPTTTHTSFYTSAPTSPQKCNLNGLFFLSTPTTPTRGSSRDWSGLIHGLRTPERIEEDLPYASTFQFEGNKNSYLYDHTFDNSQELSMAYADELFYEGKMLPLSPPPRILFQELNTKHNCSSTASSPGSRSPVFKVPFMRYRSLWNDKFDPFMTALSRVKEDDKKAKTGQANYPPSDRRCSGSPKWDTHKHKGSSAPSEDAGTKINNNQQTNGRLWPIADGSGEDMMSTLSSPECRKERIKKFLLNNASIGRGLQKENCDPNISLLHDSPRCGIGTVGKAAQSNAIMRIMKHRAKVFLNLIKGFRKQGSRKMR